MNKFRILLLAILAVIVSLRTVEAGPLPVIEPVPEVAPIHVVTGDAYVDLDATGSGHTDPNRTNVLWEWDLDGDLSFDDATGAFLDDVVFHFDPVPPGQVNKDIMVRVTDDIGEWGTYTISVGFKAPPVKPYADAGGPYYVETGTGVALDGTGSFDPDEGPPFYDFIDIVEWDIDDDWTFDYTFNDGTLVLDLTSEDLTAYGLTEIGVPYTIRIRVTDALAMQDNDTATLTIVTVEQAKCMASNIDGIEPVDFVDFSMLANDWQLAEPGLAGDINSDEAVDANDLAIFADYWLSDCSGL